MKPELSTFLFATIEDDGNCGKTSVLSALARLNVDPWQEALRLTMLPSVYAKLELSVIVSLYVDTEIERDKATRRILGLLPSKSPSRVDENQYTFLTRPKVVLFICIMILIISSLASNKAERASSGSDTRPTYRAQGD